jgi:hypothetical protein
VSASPGTSKFWIIFIQIYPLNGAKRRLVVLLDVLQELATPRFGMVR